MEADSNDSATELVDPALIKWCGYKEVSGTASKDDVSSIVIGGRKSRELLSSAPPMSGSDSSRKVIETAVTAWSSGHSTARDNVDESEDTRRIWIESAVSKWTGQEEPPKRDPSVKTKRTLSHGMLHSLKRGSRGSSDDKEDKQPKSEKIKRKEDAEKPTYKSDKSRLKEECSSDEEGPVGPKRKLRPKVPIGRPKSFDKNEAADNSHQSAKARSFPSSTTPRKKVTKSSSNDNVSPQSKRKKRTPRNKKTKSSKGEYSPQVEDPENDEEKPVLNISLDIKKLKGGLRSSNESRSPRNLLRSPRKTMQKFETSFHGLSARSRKKGSKNNTTPLKIDLSEVQSIANTRAEGSFAFESEANAALSIPSSPKGKSGKGGVKWKEIFTGSKRHSFHLPEIAHAAGTEASPLPFSTPQGRKHDRRRSSGFISKSEIKKDTKIHFKDDAVLTSGNRKKRASDPVGRDSRIQTKKEAASKKESRKQRAMYLETHLKECLTSLNRNKPQITSRKPLSSTFTKYLEFRANKTLADQRDASNPFQYIKIGPTDISYSRRDPVCILNPKELDHAFQNFPTWIEDMLRQVEERKLEAQADKQKDYANFKRNEYWVDFQKCSLHEHPPHFGVNQRICFRQFFVQPSADRLLQRPLSSRTSSSSIPINAVETQPSQPEHVELNTKAKPKQPPPHPPPLKTLITLIPWNSETCTKAKVPRLRITGADLRESAH